MTDAAIIEFLAALPLHGLLLVGIVVLYRDNQKLRDQLEKVRQVSAGNTALLLDQNNELSSIKAQVEGMTPPRGNPPVKFSDS